MVSFYLRIRQAILDRAIVTARYRGHLREMCPHVIGRKHGTPMALMYQFGGSSSSPLAPAGSPANWRCVLIDELEDVVVRPATGEWYTADDYSLEQSCVDDIDVAFPT